MKVGINCREELKLYCCHIEINNVYDTVTHTHYIRTDHWPKENILNAAYNSRNLLMRIIRALPKPCFLVK